LIERRAGARQSLALSYLSRDLIEPRYKERRENEESVELHR
jgi:hypothetical protein